jgi:hypothetical protein
MSGEAGVSVAVKLASSYETDAGTLDPSGAKSWNVVAVMEAGAIEREKVAFTGADRSTYAVPSGGVTPVTVGPATVVNPHDVAAIGVPSAALTEPARLTV